jgi:hypothetical protein
MRNECLEKIDVPPRAPRPPCYSCSYHALDVALQALQGGQVGLDQLLGDLGRMEGMRDDVR